MAGSGAARAAVRCPPNEQWIWLVGLEGRQVLHLHQSLTVDEAGLDHGRSEFPATLMGSFSKSHTERAGP